MLHCSMYVLPAHRAGFSLSGIVISRMLSLRVATSTMLKEPQALWDQEGRGFVQLGLSPVAMASVNRHSPFDAVNEEDSWFESIEFDENGTKSEKKRCCARWRPWHVIGNNVAGAPSLFPLPLTPSLSAKDGCFPSSGQKITMPLSLQYSVPLLAFVTLSVGPPLRESLAVLSSFLITNSPSGQRRPPPSRTLLTAAHMTCFWPGEGLLPRPFRRFEFEIPQSRLQIRILASSSSSNYHSLRPRYLYLTSSLVSIPASSHSTFDQQ